MAASDFLPVAQQVSQTRAEVPFACCLTKGEKSKRLKQDWRGARTAIFAVVQERSRRMLLRAIRRLLLSLLPTQKYVRTDKDKQHKEALCIYSPYQLS